MIYVIGHSSLFRIYFQHLFSTEDFQELAISKVLGNYRHVPYIVNGGLPSPRKFPSSSGNVAFFSALQPKDEKHL